MMALGYKFIIFVVLITAHLVKTRYNHNLDSQQDDNFDFRRNRVPTEPNEILKNCSLYKRCPVIQSTIIYDPPPPEPSVKTPSCHDNIIFSFSDVGLRKIGQDFISSNEIISLSLDNNKINEISPFAFRNMRNLRYLNLSGNRIPKDKLLSFAGMAKLQTLIIDNNNYNDSNMQLLKDYEIFQSLEYLHLCNNLLQNFEVPFQVAAPVLHHLYLSNNDIESSNIVFNNIPATLTHLYLENNLINRVEEEKLRYLQELIMDNNTITQMCFESCQNQFISLKGAVRLQKLSLSKNLISEVSVDTFGDTKQLLKLDLSSNRIADIAKGTFNDTFLMIDLSLADNILATIPDVCPMLHLRSLNLSKNHISAVRSNTFCHLRKLEYLYLADNVITTIESRAFVNLHTLKYLDLSGNRLRQLPAQWVSMWYLRDLHLERNNFTNLDDLSLFDIKSLKNIHLDENPMPSLKAQSFKSLPGDLMVHMKTVRIEDNCLQCKCENDDEEDDNETDDNNDFE